MAGPLCGCRSLAEIWALPSAGHTPSFTPHSSSEQRDRASVSLTHLMPFICQSQPSALHPSFCGVASRAAVCSQRSSRRLDSVHSKYLDRLKCLWFISDLSSVRSACCVRLCREHTYTSPENWDTAARDTAARPDTRRYLTHTQTRTTWCYNSVSLESLIYCYRFCRYCELDFIFHFLVSVKVLVILFCVYIHHFY